MSRTVYVCMGPTLTMRDSCGVYHETIRGAVLCCRRHNLCRPTPTRMVYAFDGADGPRELSAEEKSEILAMPLPMPSPGPLMNPEVDAALRGLVRADVIGPDGPRELNEAERALLPPTERA